METFLIKAVQLIAALAFLVVIHEFGHYLFARIFGIKVEKFYLFFNPWFSLVKWKPKKKNPKYDKDGNEIPTWRDTEYGIGWLPLGGYVKIAGMVDESMDREQLKQPVKSHEFRAKPAWQRLFVMIGGVLFNFILAIIIYAGIAWHWGEKYIPFDDAYEGLDFVPEAQAVGFRNGDIPLAADGVALDASKPDWMFRIVDSRKVTVLRNHCDTVTIDIPDDFITRFNDSKGFAAYRLPVVVDNVIAGEPAAKAGMKEGDRIVAVDTVATPSYTELTPALLSYADKPTTITVDRGGKLLKLPVTPTEGGKLGFQLRRLTDIYPTVTVRYNIFQAIPKGWELGSTTLSNYVSSMGAVFSAEGAKSIGGFGALGSLFPEKWSWLSFWEITAFLSVVLAFMNIIPIPGLDGGHVLFVLYEIVARRKPSEKFLEVAEMVGMAFILLLLVYANGNDLFRAFFK